MGQSQIAIRYAGALHSLATNGKNDRVVQELKALEQLFHSDGGLNEFVHSPLVKASEKEAVLNKALSGAGLSEEVFNFILLLAKKNRLMIFEEIVSAFGAINDESHGITRGFVESTSELTQKEKDEVEGLISNATGKKVVLNYKQNPNLIGGLAAKVGGYRFDDSLSSHLRRLTDQLNRSAH